MQTGIQYQFTGGALRPLENPALPAGTVIFYEDRANPRREFVIVSDHYAGGFSSRQFQTAICLEDGHRSQVSYCNGKFSGHWELAGRTIPECELPAVLAAARANGEKLKSEAEAAATIRAQSRAREKAALLAKYGKLLTPVPAGKYASAAHGSRNIKKHLAATFQGVKFSVRSDTYSGGDSIDISWELGPTTREVEEITGRYQKGHFNGMEDIYEQNDENQWPDLFGGAKYVSEKRGDGEADNLIAAELCRRYGLPVPADGRSFWNIRRENAPHDIGCEARQLLFRQSYPPGAAIVGIEETGETCGDDILRVVFKLGDKLCTKDTPEAAAAHFRARFAEWNPESKATLRELAQRTGRDLCALFHQYNAWQESTFAADHYADRSLQSFAALPEFQGVINSTPETAAAVNSEPMPAATTEDRPGVVFNAEKNGVELHFAAKPPEAIREQLKAAGWRWSRFSGCWYARRNSQTITLAAKLGGLTDEQARALFGGNEPATATAKPSPAEQIGAATAAWIKTATTPPDCGDLARRALAQAWAN